MKIILTGGGTAGHVSGNMALVPELKKNGFSIDYIGTYRGMEKEIVASDKDIRYHPIPAGRLVRGFHPSNVKDAFRVLKGIKEASRLIKEIKPDIVFSKGGFVTVPVVIAAHRQHIPVIIHESDITPGLANKISAKFADKICTTFPETVTMFGNKKVNGENRVICTGAPLRNELFNGSRNTGYSLCGFTDEKPVIIVMGGSLGAQAINKLVREALPELVKKYNIIHICGRGGCDASCNMRGYKQFDYVTTELPHLLAISDAAISRAGSNAIFEFLAAQIPMLLIPLPKGESRGDQVLNAESFAKNGYALTKQQEELNVQKLCESVDSLFARKQKIRTAMYSSAIQNGTDNILNLIYAYRK